MPAPQIFISYRRDDAAGYARAVYDELAREFGAERVFIDVDDIAAGQAFDEVIRQAVGASQVLLVLIGKRWLGERDAAPPRIHDADDFVRAEVSAGLARGMRVIPLLIDGAAMPAASQLPDSLRALVRRNALELDNSRFAADLQRLTSALRDALDTPAVAAPGVTPPGAATRRLPLAAMLVLALVLALAVAIAAGVLWRSQAPLPATTPQPAAGTSARPDLNGRWQADVTYDWPNARYVERFEFAGDGAELRGSASFLGVPRGIVEGRLEAGGASFVTRTLESSGGGERETVHRYRGRLAGDEIRFVVQTEGGSSSGVPIEFVARRAGAASSPAAAASR